MYDMTANRLPAPYELNQKAPLSYTPNAYPSSNEMSYAKGGRTGKHKGMIKVHINPHEVRVLDHIQGFAEHAPDGAKMFPGLEDILKNRHLVESVHKHAHQHRAHHYSGGYSPAMQHLREGGRYGDSEVAMIGPRTKHLFDSFAGQSTRNPYTGHPEYWSIGPALGGLWGAVSGAASKVPGMISGAARAAAPALQSAASGVGNALKSDQFKNFASGALNATQPLIQNALNKQFGDDWGGVAGAIGKTAQNQYIGQGDPNSIWNQAGQAAGTSINRYNQGYTPQQAAGYGMSQLGQDVGGNYGQAFQGFGNAMQGQGMGGYKMPSRQDMYNSMNSPMARNAVQDIGTNLIQGGWGGGQQAARDQASQYMQRQLPRPANMSSPHNQGNGMQQGGYGMQNQYNQGYGPEDYNYMYG
jgi:hypothetical protein